MKQCQGMHCEYLLPPEQLSKRVTKVCLKKNLPPEGVKLPLFIQTQIQLTCPPPSQRLDVQANTRALLFPLISACSRQKRTQRTGTSGFIVGHWPELPTPAFTFCSSLTKSVIQRILYFPSDNDHQNICVAASNSIVWLARDSESVPCPFGSSSRSVKCLVLWEPNRCATWRYPFLWPWSPSLPGQVLWVTQPFQAP